LIAARRGGRKRFGHSRAASFSKRLQVGDHVWIGEDVGILSLAQVTIRIQGVHQPTRLSLHRQPRISTRRFKLKVAPITVRTGSWVAAAAFVGPGVEIGAGSVVSAGSVVLENVPANVLVQGNPAAVVREIDRRTAPPLSGPQFFVRQNKQN